MDSSTSKTQVISMTVIILAMLVSLGFEHVDSLQDNLMVFIIFAALGWINIIHYRTANNINQSENANSKATEVN